MESNKKNMARSFTLDQANSALVFVKPILEDIQTAWHKLRVIKAKEKTDEEEIEKLMQKTEHYVEELQQVGCVLKDIQRGIVDFPSYFRNKPVLLCWRLGEERIEHWHPVNGSYETRKEIDEDFMYNSGDKENLAVFTH